MSRLRITLITAASMLALAALTFNSLAQPPGGRGGGGGGGFGGGVARAVGLAAPVGLWRPGGGPGGGSLLQLASNPAVQEDLKVTDKQKAQIKSLIDKYNAQNRELRAQMGGPGGPGRGEMRRATHSEVGALATETPPHRPTASPAASSDSRVRTPTPRAAAAATGSARPVDPEVAQRRMLAFQAMNQAMNELRQSAEASLGKILDKGQVARLKQIDLQRAGPDVIFRPDVSEKLNIDEAQVELLNEVRGGRREAQQETRRARGEMMKAAFQSIAPAQDNGGQNGGNGAGGNGGNGQNGNRRRGFDPAMREAMQKYMERPEIKAQRTSRSSPRKTRSRRSTRPRSTRS